MCVPSPEHTLRTLSTNRRGEGEAPPPAPSTYTPRRTRPAPRASDARALRERQRRRGRRQGGGEGGGKRKTGGGKEQRGRERRWRRWRRLLRVWGGGGGAGAEGRGFCARAGVGVGECGRAPRGVGPVGEGRGAEDRLAGGSLGSRVGRPLLPHTPPHLHPGEALSRHQGGGRCAGLPGFSALNYPPRARPPRTLFLPQPVVFHSPPPPPSRAAGREWAGVIFPRPSFRNVGEKEPRLAPRFSYQTALRVPAGSAATRLDRGSGACWELESSTAAALADPQPAAGLGRPLGDSPTPASRNRSSAGPGSCFQ